VLETKLAKPIAVVDMANLRDNSAHRIRFKKRKVVPSSWDYIDAVLDSLKSVVANLTVIPIFDAGVEKNFDGFDQETTNFRKNLSYLDPLHVYFMREHGVEADPLILKIAAETGGFVVSGDKYEKYFEEISLMDNLVFVPIKNESANRFEFFYSAEFYDLRGKYRTFDDATRFEIRTVSELVDPKTGHVADDAEVLGQVFGPDGIVSRFWDQNFRVNKQGEGEKLQDTPFSKIWSLFSEPVKEKIPETFIPKAQRRSSKKKREPILIFCDDKPQFQQFVNSEVQVVGKLGRSGEEIFLEWFRGDKTIRLKNFQTKKDLDKNFLKISGVLKFEDDSFKLEVNEDTRFEQLSFSDAVTHRLSRVGAERFDMAPRRWYLPSLQWRRRVQISDSVGRKIIPPPPGYRYRTIDEKFEHVRISSAGPSQIEKPLDDIDHRVKSDLAVRPDSRAEDRTSEATDELGASAGEEMDGLPEEILPERMPRRPPTMRRRRRRVENPPKRKATAWFYIVLLLVAALVACYFLVYGRDSIVEQPSFKWRDSIFEQPSFKWRDSIVEQPSLKCWGEVIRTCIET